VGDLDYGPAPHVIDAMARAAHDGGSRYGDPRGLVTLRAAIADHLQSTRGAHFGVDDVLVQPGGTPVILKFLYAAAKPGSEVLYPVPGYPVYRAAILRVGATPTPYFYAISPQGAHIDLARLAASVTDRTTAIILNAQHNPTGSDVAIGDLEAIADLALRHNLDVLADEAYFDIRYDGEQSVSIASLDGMASRTAILFSFSKSYSMAGWRLGAAAGPQRLVRPMTLSSRISEFCIQTPVQEAGVAALRGPQDYQQELIKRLASRRLALLEAVAASAALSAPTPATAYYLYLDVTTALEALRLANVGEFVAECRRACRIYVWPDEAFGVERDPGTSSRHVRLAFGAADEADLRDAIRRLDGWISSRAV
jgi:aspartate/methionine/tyrosine aminotransferase